MKKILLIFSVFLILAGCSGTKQSQGDDFGYETLKGQSHIIKGLTYEEIKERESNKDTYFLMIGRPSCGVCVDSVLPYSQEAEKNNLEEVYYYSFEEMVEQMNTQGKLDSKNEEAYKYLEGYLDFKGETPKFYYIKDGKLVFTSDDVDSSNVSTWNELLDKFFKEATSK